MHEIARRTSVHVCMKSLSNKPCLAAWILFGIGLLVALTSTIYSFTAPRSYLARSRAKIEPYNWDLLLELSKPAFRDSLFGRDPSIFLVPIRGTSLIEVNAEANTPQDAAERANRAVIKVMEIVTQRPGFTTEIIDRAEPPQQPHKPNVSLILAIGGVTAGVSELGAIVLFIVFASRGKTRDRQYACA